MKRSRKEDAIAAAIAASFAFTTSISIFVEAGGMPEVNIGKSAAFSVADIQPSTSQPEARSPVRVIYPAVIALRQAAQSSSAISLP